MLRRIFFALALSMHASLASPELERLLARSILDSNTPLQEVQAFTESRVPLIPPAKSAREWTRMANRWRKDTLDKVVFRGEAAKLRKQKTQVVWLDTIDGGPE